MSQRSAQLILASASPRRRELLSQIGLEVLVQPVDIDETPKQGEAVVDYVQRLAMEKAQRGFENIDDKQKLPVLGSDTVVEIDGEILGKPVDRAHAKHMLQRLSGEKHTVHTSVAIVRPIGDKLVEHDSSLSLSQSSSMSLLATSSSQVIFRALDEEEIADYLATGEADDKAGAYAIQGIAAQFIENINGSFSGVMGLPLYETAKLLKQCGIELLKTRAG
ncbi:MAG: septum formation inhibitor Maf [Proteobacteria bacterium]|nr:septum formation inhibitor Maf [Pseudomonadota bacterium]